MKHSPVITVYFFLSACTDTGKTDISKEARQKIISTEGAFLNEYFMPNEKKRWKTEIFL